MASAKVGPRPSSGETLQERSKGKDVRISNIVAAKVRSYLLFKDDTAAIREILDCTSFTICEGGRKGCIVFVCVGHLAKERFVY